MTVKWTRGKEKKKQYTAIHTATERTIDNVGEDMATQLLEWEDDAQQQQAADSGRRLLATLEDDGRCRYPLYAGRFAMRRSDQR